MGNIFLMRLIHVFGFKIPFRFTYINALRAQVNIPWFHFDSEKVLVKWRCNFMIYFCKITTHTMIPHDTFNSDVYFKLFPWKNNFSIYKGKKYLEIAVVSNWSLFMRSELKIESFLARKLKRDEFSTESHL